MNDSMRRPGKVTPIHLLFWPLGALAGVGAATYSHSQRDDWFLAFFVFAMMTYTLGWGLSEVLTRPNKVERAVYFAMAPVAGVGMLYLAYVLTNTLWLATLIGFALGRGVHGIVARILVPEISEEEKPQTEPRRDWGELGPDDVVPGSFRHSHKETR